jgi:hypothetical protein
MYLNSTERLVERFVPVVLQLLSAPISRCIVQLVATFVVQTPCFAYTFLVLRCTHCIAHCLATATAFCDHNKLQLDGSSDAPTANGHHDDDEGGVTDAAASGDEQQQQQGGAVHSANGYDYDGGGDSPHRHTGKPAAITSSTCTLLQWCGFETVT